MSLRQGYNYCPRCGNNIPEDAAAAPCVVCGHEPGADEGESFIKCHNCGENAPLRACYCPSCGQPFTVVLPAPDSSDSEDITSISAPASDLPIPSHKRVNFAAAGAARTPEDDEGTNGDFPDGGDGEADARPPKEPPAWKQVNTERVFETHPVPRRQLPPPYAHPGVPAEYQEEYEPLPSPGSAASRPGSGDSDTGQYATLGVRHDTFGDMAWERGAPMLFEGATLAGRYRITRRLGSGGFANIYLVTDSEDYLQEEIVLKLVDENLMRTLLRQEGDARLDTHEDLIRAWRSKLKVWKVISEQEPAHIVRLLGVPRIVFERDDSYCIGMLMEYMPGGDLWQHFRKHGTPRSREQLTDLMRLFLSACRAVEVLHANRLLHRDIKPQNFLLNTTGTQCKLSDFELIMEADERAGDVARRITVGTQMYMAPECFNARYSVQSDIYALGATLYHLLTGQPPRGNLTGPQPFAPAPEGHRPEEPSRLNPLVSAELSEAVLWCLNQDPAARPASVDELQEELTRLGLTGDAVNIAPVNLARLLLTHLPPDDVRDLVETLEEGGFHSVSAEADQRQRDIIEEYCYTASPYDVLKDNCNNRQLKSLTKSLGLKASPAAGPDDMIEKILTSVGFLASAREVPGIDATRTFLENVRLNLAHATTTDECIGMIQAGLSAVERTVDLLLSFYGQLLLGAKLGSFLKKAGNGKPPGRLTFGEKLGALRRLCTDAPPATLPSRIRKVFNFPLITADVFDRLGEVVRQRNISAHSPHESTRRGFAVAQRSGRQLLEHAVACMTELAGNKNVPRVVQIVSRQDDIYGRHFYLGRDDHGRSERIFTPLPLNVGRLYLFFPLTNPARINPLIFPFDTDPPARGQ